MGSSQSKTYIANAYREEIHAKVAVNEKLYNRMLQAGAADVNIGVPGIKKLGVGVSGIIDYECEHIRHIPGYFKIASGSSLGSALAGDDGRVYVSLTAGKKQIVENFPVYNGHSIIVDQEGDLQNAKCGKIWIDEHGKNHRPSLKLRGEEKVDEEEWMRERSEKKERRAEHKEGDDAVKWKEKSKDERECERGLVRDKYEKEVRILETDDEGNAPNNFRLATLYVTMCAALLPMGGLRVREEKLKKNKSDEKKRRSNNHLFAISLVVLFVVFLLIRKLGRDLGILQEEEDTNDCRLTTWLVTLFAILLVVLLPAKGGEEEELQMEESEGETKKNNHRLATVCRKFMRELAEEKEVGRVINITTFRDFFARLTSNE